MCYKEEALSLRGLKAISLGKIFAGKDGEVTDSSLQHRNKSTALPQCSKQEPSSELPQFQSFPCNYYGVQHICAHHYLLRVFLKIKSINFY